MRSVSKRSLFSFVPLVLVASISGLTLPTLGQTLPPNTSDLVAKLLPSVVAITTVVHVPVPGAAGSPTDSGTYTRKVLCGAGFIVDPSGLIVTNEHVVAGASEIYVTLHDDTRLKAALKYAAPIDMVLLHIHPEKSLAPVKWGDSAKVRPGDPVLAIGNPLCLGTTMSGGIVSALDRNLGGEKRPTASALNLDAYLQTDAALNHGNSGGPLFTLDGEVIGVDTSLVSPTAASAGLGFSIPSNDAQFVLNEFLNYGHVRQRNFGATVQPVTPDIADSVGLNPSRGVIVSTVEVGSPAASAGLQSGDIILKMRGYDVENVRAFNRGLVSSPLGQAEPIAVWRDGKLQELEVTLPEDAAVQPATQATSSTGSGVPAQLNAADLGVSLAPLTDDLREKFKLGREQTGVLVTEVAPNSIADEHGLAAGDIVVKIQSVPIVTPDDMIAAVAAARAAKQRHLLVMVQQGADVRWIGIPLVGEGQP